MPKRDEGHMAAVRQQILDAARTVFERRGVAEASMSDVAGEAGLSVGSIYVHFRSKEDVLKQLIKQGATEVMPIDSCMTAGELLGLVETLLRNQDKPDPTGQAARTALEVAAVARRNEEVQALVATNFATLRQAMLEAVQRIAASTGKVDKSGALLIGEGVLSLMVSAQAQMLIGVPTHVESKLKTARWLMAMLHGGPVRATREPRQPRSA